MRTLLIAIASLLIANSAPAQVGYAITTDLTKADANTIWTNGDTGLESDLQNDPKPIVKGWRDGWRFSVNSGITISPTRDEIHQEENRLYGPHPSGEALKSVIVFELACECYEKQLNSK
jgi:hypothetical protein